MTSSINPDSGLRSRRSQVQFLYRAQGVTRLNPPSDEAVADRLPTGKQVLAAGRIGPRGNVLWVRGPNGVAFRYRLSCRAAVLALLGSSVLGPAAALGGEGCQKASLDVPAWLSRLHLRAGPHLSPEDGMCAMEAAAHVGGEAHSDHPRCVSGIVGAFLRGWNDSLPDADRQTLRPYIPRVLNTAAGADVEATRARLVQDWYIRAFTPAWLELAGLSEHAWTLRRLRRIASGADLAAARPALENAKRAAVAAWAAIPQAHGDAAGEAFWAAARDARLVANRGGAWDAIWDAQPDMDGDSVWDVARAVAGDAAGAGAWAGAWWAAINAAPKGAARSMVEAKPLVERALAPTVRRLQQSAVQLLEAMIAVGNGGVR